MNLILDAAMATDIGRVRTNNEDSAYCGRRLVAVADGIGGLPAGELASDIVIRGLAPLERTSTGDPVASMRRAIEAANQRILEIADADPTTEGMGTTVTALLLTDAGLGLFHVGDSRCYRYRGGTLTQITKDDTFVQTLVDEGLLTAADARVHPRRSLVTQAVQGYDFTATSDLLVPAVGDRFVLCSDGLSDVVTDDKLAGVVRAYPRPQACANHLVAAALANGGPDNVTVIVADVTAA